MGDAEGAVSDFSSALAAEPNDIVSLSHRAHLLRRAGAFEAALADYSMALELSAPAAGSIQSGADAHATGVESSASVGMVAAGTAPLTQVTTSSGSMLPADAAARVKLYTNRAYCYAKVGVKAAWVNQGQAALPAG